MSFEQILSTPLWVLFPNDFSKEMCKVTTIINKIIIRKATKEDLKFIKKYQYENRL